MLYSVQHLSRISSKTDSLKQNCCIFATLTSKTRFILIIVVQNTTLVASIPAIMRTCHSQPPFLFVTRTCHSHLPIPFVIPIRCSYSSFHSVTRTCHSDPSFPIRYSYPSFHSATPTSQFASTINHSHPTFTISPTPSLLIPTIHTHFQHKPIKIKHHTYSSHIVRVTIFER